MRIYLLLLSGILCLNVYAQIPDGYYNSVAGLKGNELKNALHTIIKGHREYSYTSSSTDTWDILKEADRDPENPENVILIYSGKSVNAAQEYNSGNGWTREHVWAKSRGDFGTIRGAGTDCHNLKACSSSLNSKRSNRAFGEGVEPVWYEGVTTGNYSGSDYTFEPRDEVKGDVARSILYMAVRYNGENGEPDLDLTELIFASTDKQPVHGVKSMLLKWHDQDPVDDFERNRNDVVYSYQNNRNPFIDHPDYVNLIWGANTGISSQSDLDVDFSYSLNDNKVSLTSETAFSKVEVYNLAGQKIANRLERSVNKMDIDIPYSGLLVLMIDGKYAIKVVK